MLKLVFVRAEGRVSDVRNGGPAEKAPAEERLAAKGRETGQSPETGAEGAGPSNWQNTLKRFSPYATVINTFGIFLFGALAFVYFMMNQNQSLYGKLQDVLKDLNTATAKVTINDSRIGGLQDELKAVHGRVADLQGALEKNKESLERTLVANKVSLEQAAERNRSILEAAIDRSTKAAIDGFVDKLGMGEQRIALVEKTTHNLADILDRQLKQATKEMTINFSSISADNVKFQESALVSIKENLTQHKTSLERLLEERAALIDSRFTDHSARADDRLGRMDRQISSFTSGLFIPCKTPGRRTFQFRALADARPGC
jgi:hypothetical protein